MKTEPASLIPALIAALEPFAAFVTPDPRWLADSDLITAGSPMARKQLTAGDCRRAASTLEIVRRAVAGESQ